MSSEDELDFLELAPFFRRRSRTPPDRNSRSRTPPESTSRLRTPPDRTSRLRTPPDRTSALQELAELRYPSERDAVRLAPWMFNSVSQDPAASDELIGQSDEATSDELIDLTQSDGENSANVCDINSSDSDIEFDYGYPNFSLDHATSSSSNVPADYPRRPNSRRRLNTEDSSVAWAESRRPEARARPYEPRPTDANAAATSRISRLQSLDARIRRLIEGSARPITTPGASDWVVASAPSRPPPSRIRPRTRRRSSESRLRRMLSLALQYNRRLEQRINSLTGQTEQRPDLPNDAPPLCCDDTTESGSVDSMTEVAHADFSINLSSDDESISVEMRSYSPSIEPQSNASPFRSSLGNIPMWPRLPPFPTLGPYWPSEIRRHSGTSPEDLTSTPLSEESGHASDTFASTTTRVQHESLHTSASPALTRPHVRLFGRSAPIPHLRDDLRTSSSTELSSFLRVPLSPPRAARDMQTMNRSSDSSWAQTVETRGLVSEVDCYFFSMYSPPRLHVTHPRCRLCERCIGFGLVVGFKRRWHPSEEWAHINCFIIFANDVGPPLIGSQDFIHRRNQMPTLNLAAFHPSVSAAERERMMHAFRYISANKDLEPWRLPQACRSVRWIHSNGPSSSSLPANPFVEDLGARHTRATLQNVSFRRVRATRSPYIMRPISSSSQVAPQDHELKVKRIKTETPVTIADFSAECCICMEPIIRYYSSVRTLPCNHTYHQACIDAWMVQKTVCPLDNLEIEI